jgi:cell division protein FtsQ
MLHFKKNIIRLLLLSLWIVLGSSVLVLLVAAVNIKSRKSCRGIEIEIAGVKDIFFLGKADILKIVAQEGMGAPAGKAIADFDLQHLEAVLEKNVWVKDAELFFDNNLTLHVNILEKEPVARVFADNGSSFYIDSSAGIMPLNDKMNVKLPVFTGFPVNKEQTPSKDSMLLKEIRNLTMYILNDKFWLAQIAQVDINKDNSFEIIPTIGRHVIRFGNGDNYESKFKRLYLFYKQVLSHTGIDTYSKISVQYNNQVIGTKKGIVTQIDSLQALKNIQKLVEGAKKASEDTTATVAIMPAAAVTVRDSMKMDQPPEPQARLVKEKVQNKSTVIKPLVVKSKPVTVSKPAKKTEPKTTAKKPQAGTISKPVEGKPKPKAVMRKIGN